jgi:hypothetical protein
MTTAAPKTPTAPTPTPPGTTNPVARHSCTKAIELALHMHYHSKAIVRQSNHHSNGNGGTHDNDNNKISGNGSGSGSDSGTKASDLQRLSESLISGEIITAVPQLSNDVSRLIVLYYWYNDTQPLDLLHDDIITRLVCDLWLNCSNVDIVPIDYRYWNTSRLLSARLRLGYDMDQPTLIRLPVIYVPPPTG